MNRRALLEESIPLVQRVASSIATRLPSRVELSDLTQAGFLGLLDAATKFDRGKGVRFWTYAELRIRGAILDSLRELDWVPRSVRRRRREIESATRRLEARLGRHPEEIEVARRLGLTMTELLKARREIRTAEARVELWDGIDSVLAFRPDPNALDPQKLLERRELQTLLSRAIASLGDRERLVVALYYHEELTMKEIGEVLGVNESRVSQIHKKTVDTLRRRLRRLLHPTTLARSA